MRYLIFLLTASLFVMGCETTSRQVKPVAAVTETRLPVTDQFWQEAVVSVRDLETTARFFLEIGGYERIWSGNVDQNMTRYQNLPAVASGKSLLIAPKDSPSGLVRLVEYKNAGKQVPMRPGARSWDTGCYFSLMVRMKDMQSIYEDALAMGWWTETPITYLEFGTSKLNVMIFRGPDGVQVQGYERLAPALPEAIPEFERLTRPFNMMQMVKDKEVSYDFYTGILGFGLFHNGTPYVDKEPTYSPIGIPVNLTTTARYVAAMFHPRPGEFGRMEVIDNMDLEGRDHSANCKAPNYGILSVRFPVSDIQVARELILKRGGEIESDITSVTIEPYGEVSIMSVLTPDGAIIEFYEER